MVLLSEVRSTSLEFSKDTRANGQTDISTNASDAFVEVRAHPMLLTFDDDTMMDDQSHSTGSRQ